jgi:protein TonB
MPALSTRWRLGAALGLSLTLHLAVMLAFLRSPSPASTPPETTPVVARLVAPEPPAPPPAPVAPPTQKAAPSLDRPATPPAAREVAPVSVPPGRVAYVAARAANYDVPQEFFADKLREAQRRVPRSIDLPRPAKLIGTVRASYPPRLLASGEKGYVLAEVFVSTGGRVDDIVVLEHSGSPELARAAIDGLRRARFRAAEGAAGKARSRVTVRVDFSYE